MSEAVVFGISPGRLKIGATGYDEIAQNIKIIITTRKGTVPLDRAFGLNMDFVDRPLPVAKAMARAAIAEAVHKYEPRVRVTRIDWKETETDAMIGRLAPLVSIKILEAIS